MKKILTILILLMPIVVSAQIDSVLSIQKINNQVGGLTGFPLEGGDQFGVGVEVIGDVDHDGIDDIAVGAWLDDDGATNQGAIYILMLNADGTVKAQQKISATQGNGPADFTTNQLYFGRSIAALGDLNGDGNVDVAVGMLWGGDYGVSGKYGAVYILFLSDSGTVLEYQKISNNEGGGKGLWSANDHFGIRVENIGDLNQDGLPDLAVGAEGVNDGGLDRGAIFILNLDYNGTAKNIVKISDTAGGFLGVLGTYDQFGEGVTGLGDVDGDGIVDIAVGAMYDDDYTGATGSVWILFMNTDGTVKSFQKISAIEGGFTGTLNSSDHFGDGLVAIGDLDGDGIQELAVGAADDDDGATDAGAIWVLYLDTNGTVKSHDKISSTDSKLSTEVAGGDNFGRDIAFFGDRNNDGKIDLLVGAWKASDDSITSGEVYILHLEGLATYPHKTYYQTTPFINTVVKHSALAGETLASELDATDFYGKSICSIGDLDGDGISDIVVGAQLDDDGGTNRGAIYVQFLNADGSIKSYQKISALEGGFTGSISNSASFGKSVCSLGDLDGDGISDIAVGTPKDDNGGIDKGAVWILFLNTNGTVKSHQKISNSYGNFTGTLDNYDEFGFSLTSIDDLDGDGIIDIAVAARYDDDSLSNSGAVWILFLNTNGTVNRIKKLVL